MVRWKTAFLVRRRSNLNCMEYERAITVGFGSAAPIHHPQNWTELVELLAGLLIETELESAARCLRIFLAIDWRGQRKMFEI